MMLGSIKYNKALPSWKSGVFLVITAVFLSWISAPTQAQSLEIRRVVQNGDIVSIYYDLTDPRKGNRYDVHIFSSRDQFVAELKNVEGAVGRAIECGLENRIDFNPAKEYGEEFGTKNEEKLSFDLRGELYVSFMTLLSSTLGS